MPRRPLLLQRLLKSGPNLLPPHLSPWLSQSPWYAFLACFKQPEHQMCARVLSYHS